MALVSSRFTCATFDRRGTQGSPFPVSNLLNTPQQADDIAAVITSPGFGKFGVFCNSLGGIIACQVAIDHPEVTDHLIAHEAPTINRQLDSSERLRRILVLHAMYHTHDPEAELCAPKLIELIEVLEKKKKEGLW